MGLAGSMAKWSCLSATLVVWVTGVPVAFAQVSAADRADVVRLAQTRGIAEGEIAPLISDVERAAAQGLPATPLLNKIKEYEIEVP